MNAIEELRGLIGQAAQGAGFVIGEDEFAIQQAPQHTGVDFASNIGLVLAKKEAKNPRAIAQSIIDKLLKNAATKDVIDTSQVAGAGFVNMRLADAYLMKVLDFVAKKGRDIGQGNALKGRKIMVEFTDPNPFKEFHIGHLYSNTVGECIARLLEEQGADVKRASYQGDVGLHVAKALWGMKQKFRDTDGKSVEQYSLEDKAKFLGQAYALGSRAFESDEQAKKDIEELNRKVYAQDAQIRDLYRKGRKWSLDYFETIYKRLGTIFDFYYFESVVGPIGLNYVREQMKKGVFKESRGAIVFEGEKEGLHTRVFVNSLDLPTYEAKDLGLAPTKYKDFAYDTSIIVTAQEQSGYFGVVLAALRKINPELESKTVHLAHGMVRLPKAEGKMSSRTGNVKTAEWLLDEAKIKAMDIMKSSTQATKTQQAKVAEMVAVGAVKYSLLQSTLGKDIIFDVNESVNLEGNSGPYLQYTYARTKSVMAKSKAPILKPAKLNSEEREVIKLLSFFDHVLEASSAQYAPNFLCTYLFELASSYNNFYSKHRIIGSKHESLRLAITASVGHVLHNGLYILGIRSPEKM